MSVAVHPVVSLRSERLTQLLPLGRGPYHATRRPAPGRHSPFLPEWGAYIDVGQKSPVKVPAWPRHQKALKIQLSVCPEKPIASIQFLVGNLA